PNWKALAAIGGTIVWLMAITRAGEIAGALIEAGLPAATPAAAIRWGTTPRQRTVTGSLGDIARRIEEEGLRPPGVLVVGRVAGLRDRLGWFERLPLFGRRIVVTRARHQAGEFARALERLGAHVLLHPTIEIRPPSDDAPLEAALARLSSYDWLVLTSANGVERFFGALLERDHDIRELAGVQVAAIGPATAAAVRRRGLRVDAVPGEFRAEALLEAIGAVDGKRILLARALVAREVLPDELRKRGAEVDVVPVYETIVPEGASTLSALEDADLVTFTSSSTVSNFLRAGGAEARALLERVAIAAIGPITAETIRQEGFEVAVMPREYTIAALTGAIADYFANRKRAK
ncbi:MAG: HemD protein, partial [Deltaproteobacteria bacterium]